MTDTSQTNDGTMSIEQAFEHGVFLYQHEKKKEARQVFEQILGVAPDNAPVLQVLSVLDVEDGLWQEAINKLDRALLVESGNASLLFDKANILAQQSMNKDALEIVDSLLGVLPDHEELLAMRQQLTATIGQRGESRRAAKEVASLQQQKSSTMNDEVSQTLELAEQMLASGNTEQAKQLFQALISVAGDLIPALVGLARLELAADNIGLARQFLMRAYSEHAPEKDVVVLLSHCDIKLEQFTSARKLCLAGIKRWPEDSILCRLLVQSYEKEQNWVEAYRAAIEGIKQHGKDADLRYRLATASFNLLRTRHNFTPSAIIECQKHIERASEMANEGNKERLSTYLAEVLWYKGEAKKSKQLLEEYLTRFPNDIDAGFNVSFVYRTLEEWDKYYQANELGITCGRRLRYKGELPQWNLNRPKDDIVLVMPEQGVGDEILYFHNLQLVLDNCQKAYVACDPRLESVLSNAFPDAIMVPVKRTDNTDITLPQEVLADITSWIPGGSLAALCFEQHGRHVFQSGYVKTPDTLKQQWQPRLDDIRASNPDAQLIGLCWRSGLAAATRNMHYLVAEEVAYLLKQFPNAVFINLQYGECSKELKKIHKISGVQVVQLEGLNLRDDFDGTAAVIAGLDAVITAGTAVHRLTTAVGTPCHVFFAGTTESRFDEPADIYCENEYGYFYPPMLEDKYPLLTSMAKHVQARLK
ncbi:hypothetical protein BCS58_02900 [Enterovibrio norvegicus]|uniref:hypothetical protein n=1 Tax=Enterovibrio norvegicus TaxID=188144 RepID=UPI00389AD407